MSVNAPDRWLFLTPEGEAQLPAAVAALRAALEDPAGGEGAEIERVEQIVLHGAYADWLAYLRERRELLERYLQRFEADALAGLVVDVLWNHYLLALTVPGEEPLVDAERDRVQALLHRIHGPNAR